MVAINRIYALDLLQLEPLLAESRKEGFRFLNRFRTDWISGGNRFQKPGEGIFELVVDEQLTGIAGLSIDPYWQAEGVGRLRRVYIHPDYRGKGLGKQLVEHILDYAKDHFQLITLRTDQPAAFSFYKGLGFQLSDWGETETHHKWLEKRARRVLLETQRLVLREYQWSDMAFIHEYARLDWVSQYQRWGPNTKEETLEFLREVIQKSNEVPRNTYALAIEHKAEGRLIGGCGIYFHTQPVKEPYLGYIIHPNYWNRGFATEAAAALVRFGKAQFGVPYIKATCDVRNIASRRVLEKSGFQLERIIKNDFVQKGQQRDSYLFHFTG